MRVSRSGATLLAAVAIAAAACLGGAGSVASAADPPAGPTVSVRVAVVGVERAPGRSYPLEARCTRSDGTAVPPAPNLSLPAPNSSLPATSAVLPFALAASATRIIGVTDFPTLTVTDSCIVRAAGAEGAETSYRTTQTARADGSTPDPAPGLLESGGYHAAPARANGQAITVTQAFNGDVQVTARITGGVSTAATAPAVLAVELRCGSGFLQTARLADGQAQLFTGIPVGTVCRVADLQGGGARYADNSGDPNDGIVTVVATPASCWDLRVTGPECRVSIVVTLSAAPGPADANAPTTTSPTTTTSPSTTAVPATTAAPAVTPAPATPVEATPQFTG